MTVTRLPEGWIELPIEKLARITTGSRDTKDREDNGEYPFFVRSQTVERINSVGFDGEGVLTAGDGVGTGKIFHYINGKCDFHQRVYLMHSFSPEITGRYFYFYFSSFFYDRIMSMTAKSSVDSVRREMIADMMVRLPMDPKEQDRIVEALSDADALIEGLERLIAKKRLIKQGAMQDLLTAKRRLPGFSGEWVERKLGSVAMLQRGFDLPNSVRVDGAYPVVYSNGIMASHNTFMCEGPGVVTGRSGTIGNVTYVQGPYWPHNTALWVKNFFGNDARFIFYLLQFVDLRRFASGSGVPTLNRNDAHDDAVRIPDDVQEQVAISAVLDDMGAELQALETRLEKARQVKEGMMQNLLTGRTRLV